METRSFDVITINYGDGSKKYLYEEESVGEETTLVEDDIDEDFSISNLRTKRRQPVRTGPLSLTQQKLKDHFRDCVDIFAWLGLEQSLHKWAYFDGINESVLNFNLNRSSVNCCFACGYNRSECACYSSISLKRLAVQMLMVRTYLGGEEANASDRKCLNENGSAVYLIKCAELNVRADGQRKMTELANYFMKRDKKIALKDSDDLVDLELGTNYNELVTYVTQKKLDILAYFSKCEEVTYPRFWEEHTEAARLELLENDCITRYEI